ncbi:MAG: hypothetical protein L3K52_14875 [Candidatus Thiothrix sulfatifontis]|nr:MAG: hypothetical protein L3K52_14875 [Candidatus Thiothrix sulfatifontis]
MHALVVSVPALGEAIREEVAQLPEDGVSVALLVPATRTGRRHLLALGEACGLKQAVVYAAAPWLRNAGW